MPKIRGRIVFCAAAFLSTGYGNITAGQSAPMVLLAPEEGGPRRWELVVEDAQLLAKPSAGAAVIGEISRGAILTSFGCIDVDDTTWCAVKPLRGGRRGYVDAMGLGPAKGPDGFVATGIDDSKQRAKRGDFDAQAVVPCAQEQGQTLGKCDAGVARSGGGDATVAVTFPNGFTRSLYFGHGAFLRASSTMSGVGTDIEWSLDGERYTIRVDDQRFELDQEFVLGGE